MQHAAGVGVFLCPASVAWEEDAVAGLVEAEDAGLELDGCAHGDEAAGGRGGFEPVEEEALVADLDAGVGVEVFGGEDLAVRIECVLADDLAPGVGHRDDVGVDILQDVPEVLVAVDLADELIDVTRPPPPRRRGRRRTRGRRRCWGCPHFRGVPSLRRV